MTYKKFDARLSTLADGTPITTANSAFPDAFTGITAAGGSSVVMETTPKTVRCIGVEGQAARVEWAINTPRAAYEMMFDFTEFTTIPDNRILTIFSTGQSASTGVNLVSGALRLFNYAGGGAGLLTTPQTVYGKKVRLFYSMEIGTGATDGELHFDAFFGTDSTGTSPSTGCSFHSAAQNAGTVNYTMFRGGKLGSVNPVTIPFEYVHGNDAQFTNAGLGPLNSNIAPLVNAGPDQINVEPYTLVTLTPTDSDPDGSIVSRTWSQVGGSPAVTLAGTGLTRTFVTPGTLTGTTLTFQHTATDNSGATSTDTMAVTVLPASERVMVAGVWTPAKMTVVGN